MNVIYIKYAILILETNRTKFWSLKLQNFKVKKMLKKSRSNARQTRIPRAPYLYLLKYLLNIRYQIRSYLSIRRLNYLLYCDFFTALVMYLSNPTLRVLLLSQSFSSNLRIVRALSFFPKKFGRPFFLLVGGRYFQNFL